VKCLNPNKVEMLRYLSLTGFFVDISSFFQSYFGPLRIKLKIRADC
jgi:hypothetical protein